MSYKSTIAYVVSQKVLFW